MKKRRGDVIPLLADFFGEYLPKDRGLSGNTIKSYQYAFQLLFAFLEKEKQTPPEQVTFQFLGEGAVDEFLAWLEKDRNCSAKTRNLRRAALLSFAKYAAKKAFSASLPFHSAMTASKKKREPGKLFVRYFTKEEIALLLKIPDTSSSRGQRDVTLLSVLYSTGARAQELCDITLKDISLGNGESRTRIRLTGKGRKTRVVTIPDTCAAILRGYLQSRRYDLREQEMADRHLFSSQAREHMTIACVEEIVAKYVKLAKARYPNHFQEERYTPHSFRHSIAVHMLEAGDSLVAIKAFLGHASIMTTTIYANVTPELASKYLNERGKPLEDVRPHTPPQSLPDILPFLYRHP